MIVILTHLQIEVGSGAYVGSGTFMVANVHTTFKLNSVSVAANEDALWQFRQLDGKVLFMDEYVSVRIALTISLCGGGLYLISDTLYLYRTTFCLISPAEDTCSLATTINYMFATPLTHQLSRLPSPQD